MSALAKLLYDKGHHIAGSDVETTFFTEEQLSFCRIYPLGTILEDYVYIVGSAFVGGNDHLEVIKRGYSVYRYNEFLHTLDGIGIAISGTHGKTTTTSLIAHLFRKERIDYIIGDGSGKGIIDNDYFIYEACEYQKHFLAYYPHFLLINNIEYEHTDFYKSIEEIIDTFQELVNQSNICLINGDDENCLKLQGNNIIRFGFDDNNDYVIKIVDDKYPYRIKIVHDSVSYYYTIPYYGRHMIYNCAGAIITALIHNIGDIQRSIDSFKMPSRRMAEYRINEYLIIDDYAHHPTEIKVTLEAIQTKYNRDIVLVFEPHTYSRTLDLIDDFVDVLKEVKYLFIADVFTSVRENRQGNINFLLKRLPNARHFESVSELIEFKDKVIVFMGAGTIYKRIEDLKKIIV